MTHDWHAFRMQSKVSVHMDIYDEGYLEVEEAVHEIEMTSEPYLEDF